MLPYFRSCLAICCCDLLFTVVFCDLRLWFVPDASVVLDLHIIIFPEILIHILFLSSKKWCISSCLGLQKLSFGAASSPSDLCAVSSTCDLYYIWCCSFIHLWSLATLIRWCYWDCLKCLDYNSTVWKCCKHMNMFQEMLLTVVFACHTAATYAKRRKIVNSAIWQSLFCFQDEKLHSISDPSPTGVVRTVKAVYNSKSVHNFLWDKNITRYVSLSQCVVHSSFCTIASFSVCPKIPQRLAFFTSAHFTILISDVFIKLSLAIYRRIRHQFSLFIIRCDTHMHVWVDAFIFTHTQVSLRWNVFTAFIPSRLSFLLRSV